MRYRINRGRCGSPRSSRNWSKPTARSSSIVSRTPRMARNGTEQAEAADAIAALSMSRAMAPDSAAKLRFSSAVSTMRSTVRIGPRQCRLSHRRITVMAASSKRASHGKLSCPELRRRIARSPTTRSPVCARGLNPPATPSDKAAAMGVSLKSRLAAVSALSGPTPVLISRRSRLFTPTRTIESDRNTD